MHLELPPLIAPLVQGVASLFERGSSTPPAEGAVCEVTGREIVNLPGIVERIANRLDGEAVARSIRVVVDISPDALLLGHAESISQVVRMLAEEVLSITPRGGTFRIEGSFERGGVTLTFSNHGPGRIEGEPVVLRFAESFWNPTSGGAVQERV